MTRNQTSLLLVSLLALGCTQSPAGDKTRDLESAINAEDLADSDSPADSYTRRVAIQGPIGFGETIEGHYAAGGYAAWTFTASANARVTLDAMATDSSDTVIALYGPQTRAGWSGARPIAVNDDYRGSTNSHIDTRVSRAGTYLVIVREYWDDPGNFTLTLACNGATECRQECGAADACPTGSECHRVVCIRAPCPSYCAPIAIHHEGDSCDASLCGIAPRIVTLQCDDGSVGGFTGNCLYNADATTCHWEIRSCPTSCPPNTLLCVRGSHYDGTPGVCACVPDEVACGGRAGNTCSATQYCAYAAGQSCGRADAQATCQTRPEVCTALYQPVCGCDGVTYSNSCHAAGAGTGVDHTGPC
jgi:hypothetical protein